MSSVYIINKGVSKPIVFKGLKAQYIAYLAVGLVLLLILFAALYISGLHLIVLLVVIGALGFALFYGVFRLSANFGEHGLMKYFARRRLPAYLCFRSRRLFVNLKYKNHG